MAQFTVATPVRAVVGTGDYQHRFGGESIHKVEFASDVSPSWQRTHRFHLPWFRTKVAPPADLVLHCLYLFDTADPTLPDVLPDRHWLPLYYPMFNDACDFAYQVVSDKTILVHLISNERGVDFPYDDFPEILPEHSVQLIRLSYDEQKILAYELEASHYTEDALSDADRAILRELGYPFTQLGGIQYMPQSVPIQDCPNTACESGEFSFLEEVFATVWNNPVPDFQLWGKYMDDSQVVFQICRHCHTIYACNRCT